MIFDSAACLQNFDTLASTGSSSATPLGWELAETGSSANTFYTAGTGSDDNGNTYSFGSSGSPDRAFGGIQSGTLVPTIGASFTNGGTTAIESLLIQYTGEQWRLGQSGGRLDRLDFQYSLNASSLTTGSWLDLNALDFITPFTTTAGLTNGNDPAHQTLLSSSLTGLSLGVGQTVWIRWTDFNATGSDDGLAVDDFSLTASFAAVPEPSSLAVLLAAGLGTAVHQRRRTRRLTGLCAREA